MGHAYAAAGYYFDAAGSSNSLPEFGGVTPSSASGGFGFCTAETRTTAVHGVACGVLHLSVAAFFTLTVTFAVPQ
jgi:hypothetical protein